MFENLKKFWIVPVSTVFLVFLMLVSFVIIQKEREKSLGGARNVNDIVTYGRFEAQGGTTSTFGNSVNPSSDNLYDLGTAAGGLRWRNLSIAGTFSVSSTSFSGNLSPALNNTYDIGSLGLAWRNIFSSTSINVGSGASSATLSSSGSLTLSDGLFSSGSLAVGTQGAQAATSSFYHGVTLGTQGGNVGIGNNTPRDLLAVGPQSDAFSQSGTGIGVQVNGSAVVKVRDATNNIEGFLFAGAGDVYMGAVTSHALIFQTGGSSRMAISNTGHLVASTNNAPDLGALGNAFRNIFASTSINISSSRVSSTLSSNGNLILGGNLFTSSTNGADIGATGVAWKDVYVSNTIQIGTSVASTTFYGDGRITSGRTTDLGWTIVDGTNNTAGNAQCTSACVFGVLNETGSAVTGLVSCDDTSADLALCAGPN